MRQEIPSCRLYLSTEQQKSPTGMKCQDASSKNLVTYMYHLEWMNEDRGKEKKFILNAERCSRTQSMLMLKTRSKIGLKWDISG